MMAAGSSRPTALLLSPHPDDELLGCPAHLFALREAGWRIVNLALSLGSDERRRPQRLAELELACRRAGFELVYEAEAFAMPTSRGQAEGAEPGDGGGFERSLARVLELAGRLETKLLVAPSPHDDHPAHEWTGRLALAAARAGAAERLWLWGLWADVAMPNSLCVFDEPRLAEIERALRAHAGELTRNDYVRLLRARAELGAVLAPERVLGHGSPGLPDGSLAEALCDIQLGGDGELLLTASALFDARAFGGGAPRPVGVAGWLDGPSPRRSVSAAP